MKTLIRLISLIILILAATTDACSLYRCAAALCGQMCRSCHDVRAALAAHLRHSGG